MATHMVVTAYFAIAAFTTVWTLNGAVIQRRPVKIFGFAERTAVVLACFAVGLVWPLFIPGMTYLGFRNLRRLVEGTNARWPVQEPAARG